MVDSTNVKGAVAEQAIAFAAAKLRVPVWRPVAEHGRADLVLEIGRRLWRVQCKWGRLSRNREVVDVTTGTCRRSSSGYCRTTYTASEVDLVAVYCGELERCFLLPSNWWPAAPGFGFAWRRRGMDNERVLTLQTTLTFKGL